MDFEEKRRRQLIRVIIAEVGMVLSVIAIVVVAILAAMGFMISSNGSIEQSGLVQIHSMPTGASVKIDGNTILPRTNLSRSLVDGVHNIEIYRDGYDSWNNNVKIQAGVLLRLYYPRLFLQNRIASSVWSLSVANNLEFYAPSPKRNYIIYAEKGAAKWQLLDMRGDEVKATDVDVADVIWGMVEEVKKNMTDAESSYIFQGSIDEIIWSKDENNVLVKATYNNHSEWILVRLREVTRSLNLTRTFGLSDNVSFAIIDDAANQLYALEKNQLRRINTSDETISRVLVDHVQSFASNNTRVIYAAKADKNYQIGVYRDDDKNGTVIAEIDTEDPKIFVALSEYYGDDYMSWLVNDELTIMYGKLPAYNVNGVDLVNYKYLVEKLNLSEMPDSFSASPEGEYLVARRGKQYMVTDLADGELYEYTALSEKLNWLDDSMMYAVQNGKIMVWDFDGTNLRDLSESVVKSSDDLTVIERVIFISNNNRWLYYLANENNFTTLVREKIRD